MDSAYINKFYDDKNIRHEDDFMTAEEELNYSLSYFIKRKKEVKTNAFDN